MISKITIDKVYQSTKVEEVVGDFVSLKKSGSNFKGLSPFSNEKTPSFMVSPAKQIWKDFSSGKGGNSVAFLMEHEKFSYPEAIRYLAKKYNIEIEEVITDIKDKELASRRESMYLVVEDASKFYRKNLNSELEGISVGKSYLTERGFNDSSIDKFELGFSFNKKNAYYLHAIKNGFSDEYIEKVGLAIFDKGNIIDRFRSRIIFPIKNFSGRVVGFGGRIISEQKKVPKYINSIESEIYNKSKILYGLFESKSDIVKNDLCYLVEGYTDVIQMHQSGIKNVVSSSGTALTYDQILLIKRVTNNIVVLFDGDEAGLKASERGIEMILEMGMDVKVCQFPESEDPDNFVKKRSKDDVLDFFKKNSLDFIRFKADKLIKKYGNDPSKKSKTINDIVKIISKISDPIKVEVYINECSKVMNISTQVLFSSLSQIKNKFRISSRKSENFLINTNDKELSKKKESENFQLEYQIIKILLLYGNFEENFNETIINKKQDGKLDEEKIVIKTKVYEKIFLDLQEDEIEFTDENFKKLYQVLIENFQANDKVTYDGIVNNLSPKLSGLVSEILMTDEIHKLHKWDSKSIFVKEKSSSIEQMVTETILSLRKKLIDKKISDLQNKLNKLDKNESILSEVISYQKLKKVLAEKLNRVI